MSNSIPHKRGDIFSIDCSYTDDRGVPLSLDGIVVRSQVRNQNDKLLSELTFEPVDIYQGKYRLYTNSTQNWTLGVLSFDIEYILSDGAKTSTDTVSINCTRDETR